MNETFKKKLPVLITIIIALVHTEVNSQDSLTFKLAYIAIVQDRQPTRINDVVPDIQLGKIVHFYSTSAHLSDFKGKYLVLHFWHQYCSNCVAAFTKLEALQNAFKDKLVILPVTFQSATSVQDFFALRKQMGKPITLPCVVEDTVLRKTFPHDADPHEIIINEDGKVVAITDVTALTSQNINNLLSNKMVDLEEKKNDFSFNPQAPFLVNHNGGDDGSFMYRSMISPYIDSINSHGFRLQQESGMTRLFLANASLIELYKSAYSRYDTSFLRDLETDYLNKYIVIESGDTMKFRDMVSFQDADYATQLSFKRHYLYSYELILPPSFSLQSATGLMIEDLDRFFRVQSSGAKVKMKCLALVRTNKTGGIATRDEQPQAMLSEDKLTVGIKNKPISSLVTMLNMYYDLPPVVDETGYDKAADIVLQFDSACTVATLRQALYRYGLDVKEKEIWKNVLVLKDNAESIVREKRAKQ